MATDITTANPALSTGDSTFGVTDAQKAAGAAAYPTQYANANSNLSLNSDTLAPQAPINYNTSNPSPATDTSGLYTSAYTETPAQQQESALSGQISSLNTSLAGKDAYLLQQQQEAGIPDILQAQRDNATAIATLTKDAQTTSLLKEGAGQGAPGFVVSADQAQVDRVRAVKALSLSAISDALNNNLVAAQAKSDLAVKNKYAQQEADLAALTKNLELIKNDPNTTLQEKQQADAQTQLAAQKSAQLEQAKTNTAAVLKTAQDAASAAANGAKFTPSAQYPTLNSALQAIGNAKTPAEASQIQSQVGLVAPSTGRYKDSITTQTDAFGNQRQVTRVFDTLTGQFVGSEGQTAAQFNQGGGNNGSTTPSNSSTGTSGNGLSFEQYGLLSKTNLNPNSGGQQGTIDGLALNYLDSYLKNGTVPTASTLGRNMKPAAFAAVETRAKDAYFQATGTALPNPQILKGYQQQLIGNNNLINNLAVQEGTIKANAVLLQGNLTANNINQNAPAINGIIDSIRNALGDPNVAAYLAQNSTVSNELGSLLALKNAQGTTVHDKLAAAGLITQSASASQIAAVVNKLMQEAVNSRGAIQSASAELYKQIDPLMQDPNNPLRQQGINSSFVDKALSSQGLHYDALMQQMNALLPSHPGTQPALDAKTGQPGFATQAEIQAGTAIPL